MRWEIERDVIRGRQLRLRQDVPARRPVAGRRARRSSTPPSSALLSQVQGRTYANMFGLVERFIGAKMLEVEPRPLRSATRSRSRRWCASPTRSSSTRSCSAASSDDARGDMPPGYALRRRAERGRRRRARQVAPGRCSALTCHIELFTQAHYRASIEPGRDAVRRCGRTSSCSTGARSRSTRSSTSWSGSARTRSSTPTRARRRGRRPDRAGRRGRRHPAGAGRRRRRLLRRHRSARRSARRACSRSRDSVLKAYRWQYIVSGVLRAALPEAAGGDGHDRADAAHPGRARAADLRGAGRAAQPLPMAGLNRAALGTAVPFDIGERS